jgi:Uncharacterized protein involved in methicillin resistance
MAFSVLSTTGPDAETWRALLARLPQAMTDIHFLPEYARIYELTYGVEAGLSVWREGERFAAMPFILRGLDGMDFLRAAGETGFVDAATPYGFGGAVWLADDDDEALRLFARCDAGHLEHLRARGAATEFQCLHPLLGNHRLARRAGLPVTPRKEVAVVDLRQSEAALWTGLNRGNKSSINKARREGVRVVLARPEPALLARFESMYRATMTRLGAAEHWFFPDGYFARCEELLGPERCLFFLAMVGDTPASCFQILRHGPTAYYHFAGTDPDYFPLRPNNLLMWEVMLWAKSRGCVRLHLGGGVGDAEADSLMRYKQGFTRGTETLYTMGRVVRQDVYDRLCELKRRHETRELGAPLTGDYFPLYRR